MYWTLFHCVAMGARCSIVCPEGFQCPGAGCLSRGCQHETKRGKRTWVNISVAGSCVGRQASCKGPEEGGGGVCTFNFVPKWRRNILLDSNSKWRKQMNSGRKKKTIRPAPDVTDMARSLSMDAGTRAAVSRQLVY